MTPVECTSVVDASSRNPHDFALKDGEVLGVDRAATVDGCVA